MRNFSDMFDSIYGLYCASARASGTNPSHLSFSRFLGYANDGKIRAWKRGQWPSIEDIRLLQEKLDLSLEWLVWGRGEPRLPARTETTPRSVKGQGAKDAAIRVVELEGIIERLEAELAAAAKELDERMRQLIDVQQEHLVLLREYVPEKKPAKKAGEKNDAAESVKVHSAIIQDNKTFHEDRAEYGPGKKKKKR